MRSFERLNEVRGTCDRKINVEKDSKEEGKLKDDCTVLYQHQRFKEDSHRH